MRPQELVLARVVRTPYPPQSLACFAVEFETGDPRCQACHLRTECQKWLGRAGQRIPLGQVKFSLMPERLAARQLALADPDLDSVQAAYDRCYGTIWPGTRADRVHPDTAARLAEQAAEARCSLGLFLLTNMLGFKQANPDRQFYARMLVGPAALRRADAYRAVCRERFGTFDETALETLVGKPTGGLAQRMFQSEATAAGWVIGWKTRNAGPAAASLYAAKELCLDPVWLAIEPSYQPVLEAHRADQTQASPAVASHRFKASRALVELKRSRRLATAAFEIRQAEIPAALSQALGLLGYDTSGFEVAPVEVTDPIKFYEKIGLAMQHAACLDYALGESAVLWRGRK